MSNGPLAHPLPTSADPSHISLHSPSHIVGTPFATTSTRFEYPFPDCNTGASASLSGSSASSPGSSSTSASHCSFGSVSFSFNLPLSLPPSAQFHRSITIVSPSTSLGSLSGSAGTNHPSPTHPKLRLQGPPPIPPTLIKKRNRWNLGYLGRKKDNSPRTDLPADDGVTSDVSERLPDPKTHN
ncbi:hypothetical protein AX15_002725 [Amanita polypyramis BW_CC]|nr:hypothetical protein AX15_002725 [Amanita polypyramis BW_CC]